MKQFKIVSKAAPEEDQYLVPAALFTEDGSPVDLGGGGDAVSALAAVSAADATAAAGDTPTKAEFDKLVTLANANKAAINAVIAALKA